ncbi:MAG: hypothetical protein RLZZ401_1298 [Pseudomonadota bacterium]|jgi:hypothetical protein
MLHRLRHAHCLARLVLVWFALSVAAAVASPVVQPQSMALVCSASGALKVLIASGDATQELAGHTLDCPLCAGLGAPPPAMRVVAAPVLPLSYALRPVPAARIAVFAGAALPARGPPLPL